MSHFAKVLDGKVVQVIVAEPDFFNTFVDSSPGHGYRPVTIPVAGCIMVQMGNRMAVWPCVATTLALATFTTPPTTFSTRRSLLRHGP